MRRYLVVANQTLGGPHLVAAIRERMRAEPSSFHIVVPATRPRHQLTWTEGQARTIASERLDHALEMFRRLGADVDGSVGDARPALAIEDALLERSFDEIIISTLPPGASRWIKADLVARIERRYELPVTHIVAEDGPVAASG